MYKLFAVIVCFSVMCSIFAAPPAGGNKPQKADFNWKKAAVERKKMHEKMRMERENFVKKLKEFNKRYAAASSQKDKDAIRTELSDFIAKDFNRKIDNSKKRISNLKKFVAKLEEKQKQMELNASKIVEKRTDEVLQGKIVPPPRKKR